MLGINLNNLKFNLPSFRSLPSSFSRFSVRIFKFPRRNFSPACCAHVEAAPPPPPLGCCFLWMNFGALFLPHALCAAGWSWTSVEIETELDWNRRAASTESLSEKQRAVNARQQLRSGARRVRLSLRSQLGAILPASLSKPSPIPFRRQKKTNAQISN